MHPLLLKFAHHDAIPEPPDSGALRSVRRSVTADLLREHDAAIRAIEAGWPDAREDLVDLGDRLVVEHRRRVAAEAPLGLRGLAALDRRLPTDRVENMDRADVDAAVRQRILLDVDLSHRVLGSYERFFAVNGRWFEQGPTRVLDVASGHGGFAIALAREAALRGWNLRVTASDVDPAYVGLAADRARAAGVALDCRVLDALRPDVAPGEFDVVTCTHSLHHLSPGHVAALYAAAAHVARRGVIFWDPYRSATGALAALAIFTTLTRRPASIHDALLSIRKSFVPEELDLLRGCTPGARGRGAVRYVSPGWCMWSGPGVGA